MASNQENLNAVNAPPNSADTNAAALQNRVDAVAREVRKLSQQNANMMENFEKQLTLFKREFAYLNQQNLSVYNMTTAYVQDAVDKVQESVEEKLGELKEAAPAAEESAAVPPVEVVVDYDRIVEGVVEKLSEKSLGEKEEEPVIEKVGPEASFDYDVLAEKVAENIPPVDYDYLACKIASNMAAADYDSFATVIAEKVAEKLPQELTAEAVADVVMERLQEADLKTDTETLADAVADKVVGGVAALDGDPFASTVAEKVAAAVALASLNAEPTLSAEEIADGVIARLQEMPIEVDVDALATLVAERMEVPALEVDFEDLAENIASKIDLSPLQTNVEELAETVASKIDYGAVADKILEATPQTDYEEVASRLAEKLNGNEEDVEAYLNERGIEVDETDSSDRVISAVEENSGKTNALVEEVIELLKGKQFVTVAAVVAPETEEKPEEEPQEAPVQELVAEPVEEPEEVVEEEPVEEAIIVVQELVEEPAEDTTEEPVEERTVIEEPIQEVVELEAEKPLTEEELEVSIAAAMAETAAMVETAQDLGKAVRLKRSYECKLRQSSDEVKYYYSEIKNELLSYSKVKSSMSWNGDRFNLGRETVAKMSINGKTLCLYLALNPDEYSITKYHHKYVGDVKAYESTPMLVKVKSNMGLKKAVALVCEMLENMKAQRIHRVVVDYVVEYAYKSDEQMIAEGLIKASMTEKKDLNSF